MAQRGRLQTARSAAKRNSGVVEAGAAKTRYPELDALPNLRRRAVDVGGAVTAAMQRIQAKQRALDAEVKKLEGERDYLQGKLEPEIDDDDEPDARFRTLHDRHRQVQARLAELTTARRHYEDALGQLMKPYRETLGTLPDGKPART